MEHTRALECNQTADQKDLNPLQKAKWYTYYIWNPVNVWYVPQESEDFLGFQFCRLQVFHHYGPFA